LEKIAMAEDWYVQAAQARAVQLEADRATTLAGLAQCRANGDRDTASELIQSLANLDAEKANLLNLTQQYAASQQPPQAPELSAEERAARPWHRMDWNDVVDMARGSKWAKNIAPNDPNMIAGWREAQRRKARGE
jgi:hypothetical protein